MAVVSLNDGRNARRSQRPASPITSRRDTVRALLGPDHGTSIATDVSDGSRSGLSVIKLQ